MIFWRKSSGLMGESSTAVELEQEQFEGCTRARIWQKSDTNERKQLDLCPNALWNVFLQLLHQQGSSSNSYSRVDSKPHNMWGPFKLNVRRKLRQNLTATMSKFSLGNHWDRDAKERVQTEFRTMRKVTIDEQLDLCHSCHYHYLNCLTICNGEKTHEIFEGSSRFLLSQPQFAQLHLSGLRDRHQDEGRPARPRRQRRLHRRPFRHQRKLDKRLEVLKQLGQELW